MSNISYNDLVYPDGSLKVGAEFTVTRGAQKIPCSLIARLGAKYYLATRTTLKHNNGSLRVYCINCKGQLLDNRGRVLPLEDLMMPFKVTTDVLKLDVGNTYITKDQHIAIILQHNEDKEYGYIACSYTCQGSLVGLTAYNQYGNPSIPMSGQIIGAEWEVTKHGEIPEKVSLYHALRRE